MLRTRTEQQKACTNSKYFNTKHWESYHWQQTYDYFLKLHLLGLVRHFTLRLHTQEWRSKKKSFKNKLCIQCLRGANKTDNKIILQRKRCGRRWRRWVSLGKRCSASRKNNWSMDLHFACLKQLSRCFFVLVLVVWKNFPQSRLRNQQKRMQH